MDIIDVIVVEKQGRKIRCRPQNRPPGAWPAGVTWKCRSTRSSDDSILSGLCIYIFYVCCHHPHVCTDCSVTVGKKITGLCVQEISTLLRAWDLHLSLLLLKQDESPGLRAWKWPPHSSLSTWGVQVSLCRWGESGIDLVMNSNILLSCFILSQLEMWIVVLVEGERERVLIKWIRQQLRKASKCSFEKVDTGCFILLGWLWVVLTL